MTSTPRTRAAALPVMLVAAAAIAAALPDAVTAADLKVVLNNFRGSGGTAYVALYDKAELFPKDGKNNYGQFFPVTGATGTVIFLGLKPGRYAVSAYHDENNNGHLDTNLLGMPVERYGFSRDAAGSSGPPIFDDAAVDVEEDSVITINLR